MKLYENIGFTDLEGNFGVEVRGKVTTKPVVIDENVVSSLKRRYIAFDTETTGLNPSKDRIIELGAVLFENGKPTAVNNITNDMLESAPTEDTVYSEFIDFLEDVLNQKTIICAHNAKFDMGFLSETLMRLGYDANINYIDTLAFSKNKIRGLYNYKQDTVAGYFNIKNEQAHRAASDAETCGKILWNLLELK